MRALATACLLASAACAQLPNPVTSGDRFNISGAVTDAVSAKPLAGAQVTLRPTAPGGSERTLPTNESGVFAFPDVPTGTYSLDATRSGYASGASSSSKVILVSGTQPDRFDLALQPQAILTGIVTGPGDTPVSRAHVLVLRPAIAAGHRIFQIREEAETNDHGAFRIAGLSPGPCYVAVTARTPAGNTKEPMAYPVTYFPNTIDPLTSPAIELRPGAEQQADLQLAPVPAFRISGRVSPFAETVLSLLPTTGSPVNIPSAVETALDAKTGNFTLSGVPPGTYLLRATAKTSAGKQLSAYRPVAISGNNLTGINLNINALSVIEGSVHTDSGQADQAVSAIALQSSSGVYSTPARAGRFAIPGAIPPGAYQLIADLAPNWYLQSATQGGRDVLHGRVLIAEEGASQPLLLSASPRGATLEATVTWPDTSHRVPAHVLVLQPFNGEMLLIADAKVPAPNEPAVVRPALIGGLAPGQYVVYAWPEPLTVEYANPEALHPYDAFAQPLSIDEGQLVRAALKLALP